MGIRPLFHVKLKLVKRDIPSDQDHCVEKSISDTLPKCSRGHEPKLRWPAGSVEIGNPHLAPTASVCGMRTGAQGTDAAGYAP